LTEERASFGTVDVMKILLLAIVASVAYAKEEGAKELFSEEQGMNLVLDDKGVHTIIEGDIVLDKREKKAMDMMKSHPNIAFDVSRTGKWVGGVVPYVITQANGRAKAAISAAIADFHKYTCLKFVQRTNQRDFISIIAGGGCYSYIGRIGGKQDLSLGSGCEYKSTAIHEFMHALGFWHEQSRRDRDNYVTINYSNIPVAFRRQFDKYQPSQAKTHGFRYDKQSVMHYSRTAFGSGKVTIYSKSNYNEVLGNRNGMTSIDIAQIKAQYNCAGNGTSTTTSKPTNQPATTASPPSGEDNHDFCPLIRSFCHKDIWVEENCVKTCHGCDHAENKYHNDAYCTYWADKRGFCHKRFVSWMKRNCAKACCEVGVF